MKTATGILLRYADNMLKKNVDTISEHNKIIKEYGIGYVGKIGKFIGNTAIKICNDKSIERFLILAKREVNGYVLHGAKIESAQTIKPQENLIPEYYRKATDIKSWICVKVKKQPPDLTAGEFNRREC